MPDGSVMEHKSTRVELATGMHYRDGNDWVESKELIEPDPNGAVARYGPNKAAFTANLNTRGAIQVVDADGKQFTSHVLGLAYTDMASGQSVMIAFIKDSFGQILPPNQIVYPDAFLGDVKAAVRYTYTRDGLEQDIVIQEALEHTPQEYGLDPDTTHLEVVTEFLEAPAALAYPRVLREETDQVKRQAMVQPDFVDQELEFGALKIGEGKAIDFQGVVAGDLPVGKTYENENGRVFLIEAVEFPTIAPALNALPPRQAKAKLPVRKVDVQQAANKRLVRPFPATLKQQAAVDRRPMKQVASLNLRPGVLLDYVFTMTSGVTNFLFRPEATHSVSGTITLYGTSTIMGGTIVKYARGGVLALNGSVVCDTTPYHPAVFTAWDDNTMGDVVESKSLSGYYAVAALRATTTVTGELHDLRFSYTETAIDWKGSQERFYNLQFINCSNAIRRVDATNAPVHNILATNTFYVFTGSNSTFIAQHLTANRAGKLINITGTPAKLTLTNSILVNVTNAGTGTIELDYAATNGTASLPAASHGWTAALSDFQISVGGYHYLTTNSALHDVGTTNISANLLSEIQSLTTYAPTLLTSTANVSVTFSPIVPRDNDTPDLGYHYTPLDYIVRGYKLNTNVVLTMTNSVAVGVDYNGGSWGLIFDTATNLSIGSPTNMNRFVRAHCVQEISTGNPTTRAMLYDIGDSGTHGNSEARFRFTEFANMVADGATVYFGKNWVNWEWSHSWLYNLSINFKATNSSQTVGITNNVIEWGDATLQRSNSSSAFHLRNNLFRRHSLDIANLNSSSTIKDNLFDTGSIFTNGTTVTHSYNAYYLMTNGTSYATNALPGLGNNLPLTSLTYQTEPYGRYGPIGRYYQPTNSLLINAGSQNATNAGLYHFTCTTNQVKETNSTVDIGPHWVALDASGNLQDYDGDGVPDYYEDWNGNGSVDSGETDWQDSNDWGLKVFITRPRSGGTLP